MNCNADFYDKYLSMKGHCYSESGSKSLEFLDHKKSTDDMKPIYIKTYSYSTASNQTQSNPSTQELFSHYATSIRWKECAYPYVHIYRVLTNQNHDFQRTASVVSWLPNMAIMSRGRGNNRSRRAGSGIECRTWRSSLFLVLRLEDSILGLHYILHTWHVGPGTSLKQSPTALAGEIPRSECWGYCFMGGGTWVVGYM